MKARDIHLLAIGFQFAMLTVGIGTKNYFLIASTIFFIALAIYFIRNQK